MSAPAGRARQLFRRRDASATLSGVGLTIITEPKPAFPARAVRWPGLLRSPPPESGVKAIHVMTDYAAARHNMVESQIRTNRVTDGALLAAMETLPREQFVPGERRSIAYVDEDIEIAPGRYLMEPMVLARLLQVAEVEPDAIALDIGCGTGYSTAVLARLCQTVVGVESDPALATRATETLTALGIDNALVVEAGLTAGYPKQAPYDVILFSGAIAGVPDAIARQLAPGGRAVAVVAGRAMGQAHVFTRVGDVLSARPIFDAATPLLPDYTPEEEFVF
jgi:protein-L-isoaspartate(D-aspartate) O-methyltransferase